MWYSIERERDLSKMRLKKSKIREQFRKPMRQIVLACPLVSLLSKQHWVMIISLQYLIQQGDLLQVPKLFQSQLP